MRWFPFVTFWQVSADLANAAGVPDGHGHNYGTTVLDVNGAPIASRFAMKGGHSAEAIETVRRSSTSRWPVPPLDGRRARVLQLATRLLAIVELATADQIAVTATEKFNASLLADEELRKAVEAAHRNIRNFAKKSLRRNWSAKNAQGARVGEKFDPFTRVAGMRSSCSRFIEPTLPSGRSCKMWPWKNCTSVSTDRQAAPCWA